MTDNNNNNLIIILKNYRNDIDFQYQFILRKLQTHTNKNLIAILFCTSISYFFPYKNMFKTSKSNDNNNKAI